MGFDSAVMPIRKVHGEITPGSLVAFLVYAVNISNPIKRLTRVIGSIQKALAAAQRVFYILDLEDGIKDKPDAIVLPPVQGAVEFQHVGFAYNENEPVLQDVSFKVEPGQVVALVGPSGAGKSTIANLLPRFYDVTSGNITIDGHVGIYAYRRDFLLQYAALAPTPMEQIESLEQLRVLENGFKIKVLTSDFQGIGIDTKEDLDAVNKIFEQTNKA